MIILDCPQGTEEWYQARAGIPTASEFDRVVTATGRPSSQQDDYLALLLAEYATGETDEDSFSGFWMDRGKELEPEARAGYRFETGNAVQEVGFVWKDKRKLVGCSPDGLIYTGKKFTNKSVIKGAEIKCPKARNHGAYWIQNRCPKKYIPQIQGSMWVTGLERWDFVSYHPNYDLFIIEVEPDLKFMRALDEAMEQFLEKLIEGRKSDRVQALLEQRLESAA